MNKFDQFTDKCKRHNLKITPQRALIFKAVMSSDKHPSAEAVHKEVKKDFPSISLDTVCRTLNIFSEIGFVDIVEGRGYPKRFDPDLEPHHHFHCLTCGEITDFFSETLNQVKIPGDIEQRFEITGKRVVLKGHCQKCRNRLDLSNPQ